MYSKQPIQILDFQPDSDPTTPGILLDCNNIVGDTRGLLPSRKFDPIPTAQLTTIPLGCYTTLLANGTYVTIVVTLGGKIFRFDSTTNTWIDMSSPLIITHPTRCRFATFGNDIIVVNGRTGPLISQNLATFDYLPVVSDLPALEMFSSVAVSDEGIFLIFTNTDQWRFSEFSDVIWTPDVAQGTFRSGNPGTLGPSGPITGAVRIRGGMVFYKEKAVIMMQFAGPPFFWNPTVISETIGCKYQEAVVNAGDIHLFVGTDDFWTFDGSSVSRLPNNLKTWFFNNLANSGNTYVSGLVIPFPSILGRWDFKNSRAVWHFTSTDPTILPGTYDKWIALDMRSGKWTKGTLTCHDVVLQDLPLTFTMGAGDFTHFVVQPNAIIDDTNTLNQESTLPDESFLLTGEYGDGSNVYQLSRVRPIFSIFPTDRFGKLDCYKRMVNGWPFPDPHVMPVDIRGPSANLTLDGAFNILQNARSHQLKMSFKGDYNITAFAVDFTQNGEE